MENYEYMLCIKEAASNVIMGDIYKFNMRPGISYDKEYWKELSKVEVLIELGKGAKVHTVR